MQDSNAELGIRNCYTYQCFQKVIDFCGVSVAFCRFYPADLLNPFQDKGLGAQEPFNLNSRLWGIHTSNPVIPAASNRNRGSSETAEINP